MALNLKNILLLGLIMAELVIFGGIYLAGKYGVSQFKSAQREQHLLADEVASLKNQVLDLQDQLQIWQNSDFPKEKMARERLDLSRANEQIYYLE